MIIDFHCHIDFERAGGPDSASPEEIEKHLSDNGIQTALLQPYSIKGDDIGHHLEVNRKVAEYAHNNGHYSLLRVDPFRFTDDEIERLVKTGMFDLGMFGIKLHPMDGYHISDLQQRSCIFELADHYSIPVMIHTWTRTDVEGLNQERFEDVAELARVYDNPFIAAHVDVSKVPFEECMSDCPNLYVDVSLHPFAPLRDFVMADPSNPIISRMFYGSDFGFCKLPNFDDRATPENIRAGLPAGVAHKILYQNAHDFLVKRI